MTLPTKYLELIDFYNAWCRLQTCVCIDEINMLTTEVPYFPKYKSRLLSLKILSATYTQMRLIHGTVFLLSMIELDVIA